MKNGSVNPSPDQLSQKRTDLDVTLTLKPGANEKSK